MVLRERENETELLSAALDRASEGGGALLAFSGPFGIGRSAVLAAAAAAARDRGARVLRALATTAERDIPFGVLSQFSCCATDSETGPDFGTMRGGLLASPDPVLLVVDDLQRADVESLRWLDRLCAAVADSAVLVVVAHRDGEQAADPETFQRLLGRAARRGELRPLSPGGVAAVVRDVFGVPGDERFTAACHRASHGRPFLLNAIAHGLRDSGRRPQESDVDAVWSLRPSVVAERAGAVLRPQPEPVLAAARAVALLDGAEPDQLADLAGLAPAECAGALAALAALGVLVEPARPRFAHPVIREVVENTLEPPELAEWHRRAARLLQRADRPAEAVAEHLLASDATQGEWTTGVLHAAGRRALDRGDVATAIRCLRRALLACPTAGTERSVLLADLAEAERSGAPVASMRHLSQALPKFDSDRRRAEALADVPPMLLAVAPLSLLAELEEFRAREELDPAVLRAIDTRIRLARLGDPAWCADTRELFDSLVPGEHVDPERVSVLLHSATLTGGDAESVLPWAKRAVAGEHGPGAAFGAVALAARTLAACDEVRAAEQWLAEVTAALGARGDRAAERLIVDAERAFTVVRSCRYPEAVALAESALRRCDPGLIPVVERCFEVLSIAVLDSADTGSAARALGRHREWDHAVQPWVRELRDAALAVSVRDTVGGLEHLLECGRERDRLGWSNPCLLPWRGWAALLYHRVQRPGPAAELIAEEYRRAVAWGAPSGVGRALRVWGAITEGEPGVELLRRAVEALDGRGPAGTVELAKAHLMLGRRLLCSDRAEAAARLNEGDELAAACGVPRLRAAEEIAAEGGGAQAELTRAELRIARLVAGGLGNQQVATELGVSSRAVEKHLTKVYRKLGVTGRAGLTDLADSLDPA
ncbi:LuxR C-terminal-related transcriptional regulator [Saccharopolyspora gregorii]|uniref:LuxR C-terminal-related transcriptional regulator n=1 Tax=Saccharopolyspora gregorii TaxID=33914 RepID=UPI0021ABD4CD|nr:LuxR family transcriptional regulator [Saccharopolyspora gregorii]